MLHDIGIWCHYVGDASQPLHVTVHFNGWGNFPNPKGYTDSKKIHAYFEGEFVKGSLLRPAVAVEVGLYQSCSLLESRRRPAPCCWRLSLVLGCGGGPFVSRVRWKCCKLQGQCGRQHSAAKAGGRYASHCVACRGAPVFKLRLCRGYLQSRGSQRCSRNGSARFRHSPGIVRRSYYPISRQRTDRSYCLLLSRRLLLAHAYSSKWAEG
jgi:hypothetical protein